VNDILNQINRGRIVIICISYIIYVSYEFEIYIYFIIIEEEHAGGDAGAEHDASRMNAPSPHKASGGFYFLIWNVLD